MVSETAVTEGAQRIRPRLIQVTVGLEPDGAGGWRCSVLGEQAALYVGETGEAVIHRERNGLIGVSHPAGTEARAFASATARMLRAFADAGMTLAYGPDDFRHAADALDAKAQDANAWQTATPTEPAGA